MAENEVGEGERTKLTTASQLGGCKTTITGGKGERSQASSSQAFSQTESSADSPVVTAENC